MYRREEFTNEDNSEDAGGGRPRTRALSGRALRATPEALGSKRFARSSAQSKTWGQADKKMQWVENDPPGISGLSLNKATLTSALILKCLQS